MSWLKSVFNFAGNTRKGAWLGALYVALTAFCDESAAECARVAVDGGTHLLCQGCDYLIWIKDYLAGPGAVLLTIIGARDALGKNGAGR